jgi:DNA sulfur modification protein DndB
MTNKTFIPAFKANVGDWDYYICIMKYGEAARQVGFAYELGGNADLNTLIQRGIGDRTKDIRDYLLRSNHRFLGALIVAVWGGDPQYLPIKMDDPDGMLSGIDREFGVLTLDGTQQYVALDGQHRLKAIKDAVHQNPELGKEDICIIMVAHYNTDEGKLRTRRLFTNINRNAKATTGAENIVLDEDDGAAILTRRLLTDHPFLKQEGIVKVFTRMGDEGNLKLAAGNVPQTDRRAFTTIVNLYELVRDLCFDLDASMRVRAARPSDETLETSYTIISKRLDEIIEHTGDVRSKLAHGISPRDLRAPKGTEAQGHPFMRPVVQKAAVRIATQIAVQRVLDWDTILDRLSGLPWTIGQAPWLAVFNPANGKMITAKENVGLLDDLLYVHLAAPSKQAITKARRTYREVRGTAYPISDQDLQANLTPHAENRTVLPDLVPTPDTGEPEAEHTPDTGEPEAEHTPDTGEPEPEHTPDTGEPEPEHTQT